MFSKFWSWTFAFKYFAWNVCTLNEKKESKGKVQKKKLKKKKLTNVSFMYVCVAENGEMLVFFLVFFPNNSLIDNSLSE